MLPADDDILEPGSDVNAVIIPEPLVLVARRLVLVKMPSCDHAKLCEDEILKHVERWLEEK